MVLVGELVLWYRIFYFGALALDRFSTGEACLTIEEFIFNTNYIYEGVPFQHSARYRFSTKGVPFQHVLWVAFQQG